MLLTRKANTGISASSRLAQGLNGALAKTIDRRTFLKRSGLGAGAGALADCVQDGCSRTLDWSTNPLPSGLAGLLGRPASGSYTVFPLLGSRKVIAALYVDNGRKHTSIDDVEFLEVATSQIGLYYENELLRRQLHSVSIQPVTEPKSGTHE